MRGVGGPLLCIGDLLSDVGDDNDSANIDQREEDDDTPPPPRDDDDAFSSPSDQIHPSDLHRLFQDDFDKLIQSLEGNDHSWTASTLKLCAALKTADKLVSSANSNIDSLLKKVGVLESILKRGDSAVAAVKAIQFLPPHGKEP